MSHVSANYTNPHENMEGTSWNDIGDKHQNVKKSKNSVHPASSEMICNTNGKVMEQNTVDDMKNVTRQLSKKKTNWCKLSEFSGSAWGSSTKEKNIPSQNLGTVPRKCSNSSGNFTDSHEIQRTKFHDSKAETITDNKCSRINCQNNKINDATINTEIGNIIVVDIEEKRRLRRERQKVKKEMKKQEKAIQREEEMRKKRLAPKDQKVTIIDHNTLDKLLVKDATPSNMEVKGSSYSDCEFPSLGEVTSSGCWCTKHHRKSENRRGKSNTSVRNVSSEKHEAGCREMAQSSAILVNNMDQCTKPGLHATGILNVAVRSKSLQARTNEVEQTTEDSKKAMKSLEDKVTGKRPKRRDPIQLDINEILKVQETKHEVTVKQHANKILQKTDFVRYSGNILDSDNPERKRGKQREVPKPKKPSNLKQIILQERAKRREAQLLDTLQPKYESTVKEQNLSNDKGNPDSGELLISGEQNSLHVQKESVESTEKELEEYSENCNKISLITTAVYTAECIHFQLENTDTKECKNCEIQENQSENPVLSSECVQTNVSEEKNTKNIQPQTSEIVSVCQSKSPTPKIHSRKFRDYCDHCITPEILTCATALLEDIIKFHDRQFARSPLKASAKRRHVTGLKEVRRFLALRRVRLLVIAPDLEPSSTSGGLDDIVAQLKETATANNVPYIFALGRRQLGYILKKKVPVSCVGVLNYDGTEHNFRDLMSAVEKAREDYKLRISQLLIFSPEPQCEISLQSAEDPADAEEDVNKEVVASLLAKLNTLRETPSPFLAAIERCNSFLSDYDGGDE